MQNLGCADLEMATACINIESNRLAILQLIYPSIHKKAAAADDAKTLRWFPLSQLPPLAFDHAEIIAETLKAVPDLKR